MCSLTRLCNIHDDSQNMQSIHQNMPNNRIIRIRKEKLDFFYANFPILEFDQT